MQQTHINISCDACGAESGKYRKVFNMKLTGDACGFQYLRLILKRRGWIFTASKDFCCHGCRAMYERHTGRILKVIEPC